MEIKMKLDADKLKQIALRIGGEVMASLRDIKGARGVFGIYQAIRNAIERVEDAGAELKLVSEDKKEIAVLAVLAAVPDRWFPDWVLRPFVEWGVERAVAAYNASNRKSGL